MLASLPLAMRLLLGLGAAALFVAGAVLGYIAVFALRRGEGVFLPAGYVAVGCLAGAYFLVRALVRG